MTVKLETGRVFHRSEAIAELVLEHSAIAPVLRRHRIDFSAKGSLTLEQVCELNGTSVEVVLNDLHRAVQSPDQRPFTDPRAMSPAALMFHIVARHHSFLRDVLSVSEGLAMKVERVHAGRAAPLTRIREVVHSLRALLEPHIEHEEVMLFPALLEHSMSKEELLAEAAASKTEHARTSALLSELRQLTNDYKPPEWADSSVRGLYHQLEGLEADTLEHVHLENYVLFPALAAQRKDAEGHKHG